MVCGCAVVGSPDKQGGKVMKRLITVIAVTLSLLSVLAIAHNGGTGRNGCHMDHKTGFHHCH